MKKHIYTTLIMLPYFFSVSGMLVLDDGDKKIIPLLLISVIFSIIAFKKSTILNNLRHPLIWLIIISGLYTIFSYYYHGVSSRELRALLGAGLFLMFFPYTYLSKKVLNWLILIGGVTLSINSLYFNVYMGVIRDAGYINPIPYATASALLGIISFSLLITEKNVKNKITPFFSFLLFLIPIILSEARGVWLAFIASFIIIGSISFFKNTPNKKKVSLTLLTTIITISSGFYLFQENMVSRYNGTIYEIKKIHDGDYSTSFGLRLKMWQLAPDVISKKPILGHGQDHYKILKEKLDEKLISNELYHYTSSHYHNQILDKMVKSGFIGLILYISILTYPLMNIKNMQEVDMYMVIGITTLLFVAGLTDVPFNHPQPLLLYLLFLVPICSRCKRVTND